MTEISSPTLVLHSGDIFGSHKVEIGEATAEIGRNRHLYTLAGRQISIGRSELGWSITARKPVEGPARTLQLGQCHMTDPRKGSTMGAITIYAIAGNTDVFRHHFEGGSACGSE